MNIHKSQTMGYIYQARLKLNELYKFVKNIPEDGKVDEDICHDICYQLDGILRNDIKEIDERIPDFKSWISAPKKFCKGDWYEVRRKEKRTGCLRVYEFVLINHIWHMVFKYIDDKSCIAAIRVIAIEEQSFNKGQMVYVTVGDEHNWEYVCKAQWRCDEPKCEGSDDDEDEDDDDQYI